MIVFAFFLALKLLLYVHQVQCVRESFCEPVNRCVGALD